MTTNLAGPSDIECNFSDIAVFSSGDTRYLTGNMRDWGGPMSKLAGCYNIDDLAALAKKRLPRGLYEFIDRGAEDEVTTRENAASIKRVLIRQRVAVDVSNPDFSTTLFGVKQTMPLGLAVT